jgi:hypothetical protein
LLEREAACACGDLWIRVRGEPRMVGMCHCRQCQRRTGAPFGLAAFFGADQEVAREGASTTWTRVGDSGNALTFHHCPTCGSTVFWTRSHRPELLTIAVGAFADPSFPPPARASWAEARHDWLPLPDQLQSYEQNP